MKYKLIKDNDKFRLLNSTQYIYCDSLPNPDGSKPRNKVIKTSRGVIRTKILTDGQIKSVTDLDSEEFILPKSLEDVESDVREAKDLELINHNYVIKILTQIESRNLNNRVAFFEVIKDIEVYIKDKNDKQTLKNIKKTLNLIYGSNSRQNNKDVSYQKTDFDVYQLVK